MRSAGQKQAFAELLAGHIQPDEHVGLTFATLARISLDGQLLLLRNRRDIERYGSCCYTPVGGAVSISDKATARLAPRIGMPIQWEREPEGTRRDLRLRTKPAGLLPLVDWYDTLDADRIKSPASEIIAELAQEERLMPAAALDGLQATRCGALAELRFMTGLHRLHVFDVWDVGLPAAAQEALVAETASSFPLVMLVPNERQAVERLVTQGIIGFSVLALTNSDYASEVVLPTECATHAGTAAEYAHIATPLTHRLLHNAGGGVAA
jgi:hypothetical protein